MRIGFYLERKTFLKTMGCLIETCVARGHEVILYYEKPGRPLGDKAYQVVNSDTLKVFSIQPARFIGIKDFSKLDPSPPLDMLVTHEGFHTLKPHLDHVNHLKARGTKIISLVHFFEITLQPLEALDTFDLTVYPSAFCRDLHFDLQSEPGKAESERKKRIGRFVVAGAPLYDQLRNVSRLAARTELKIPADKKVVLLIAPVISPITPWRLYVWGKTRQFEQTRDALRAGKLGFLWEIWFGNRFKDVVRAIREFCDRNGAMLIVKSRGKQKDIPYLVTAADAYFDGLDDVYFPVFTSYKLMAAADLCITVKSMASTEAVASGVPCVNIYIPHHDLAAPMSMARRRYNDVLSGGKPDSLMNYSGCVTHVDRRQFVHWLENKALSDFSVDANRRIEYLRWFLGIEERPASQRVLETLENFKVSKIRTGGQGDQL